MKGICIFMLLCCLQISALAYTQDRITLNMQSVNLKKVLLEIEKQTSYRFLYNEALLKNKPKIDVQVTNAEVNAVLNSILEKSGIGYEISESKLVVLRASGNNQGREAQAIPVTGKVTGPAGEPVSGVSVTVKGTSTGTTTDAAGNFSITVPDENAVLVFSSVGFAAQEAPVGSRTVINITLSATTSELNTVVVVGYGTSRKKRSLAL